MRAHSMCLILTLHMHTYCNSTPNSLNVLDKTSASTVGRSRHVTLLEFGFKFQSGQTPVCLTIWLTQHRSSTAWWLGGAKRNYNWELKWICLWKDNLKLNEHEFLNWFAVHYATRSPLAWNPTPSKRHGQFAAHLLLRWNVKIMPTIC
jgi:hypothetical protein